MTEFFQLLDPNIPLKSQSSRLDDPFLYRGVNPSVYFVTCEYNKKYVTILKNAMRNVFGYDRPEFSLIYAFKYKLKKDEFTSNMSYHLFNSVINFEEYIPKNSKIVSIGRALYTLTKETRIDAMAFYPYEQVNSFIFHPVTNSIIFPVDDFSAFIREGTGMFLDNFHSFFLFKQIKQAVNFEPFDISVQTPRLKVVEDPNSFLIENKDKYDLVVWDLETTGLSFYKDKVICITMSFDGKIGYYLDFEKIDLNILDDFFKDKYQIGANLKFDIKFMKYLGLKNVKVDYDTLNAGHILNEMTSNSLSSHGWRYTLLGGHEVDLQKYLFENPKTRDYAHIPRSILATYASMDSVVTYHVYKEQLEELKAEPSLYKYYFGEVVPNLNMFADIELKGVPIDWDYLGELKEKLDSQKHEIEEEIYKEVGKKFNISSHKELSKILQYDLKLPSTGYLAKDNSYLTNEDAMNVWIKSGFPIAKKIMDYRSIDTQIGTFVGSKEENTAYWKYKSEDSDTVHPNYAVMLAQSHRNKCNEPNFQQIPKRSSQAKTIRKMFKVPSDEYLFFEGDYSAMQMRVAAIMSGDKNLTEAFTKYGGDVHSMTAIAIFHRDWDLEEFIKVKHEQPYKAQRNIAKGTNFSFLFGAASKSFTDTVLRVEWSEDYCKQFVLDNDISVKRGEDIFDASGRYIRDSFFTKYPGLRAWHEKSHETARRTGMVTSIHGARRLLPQLRYTGADGDGRIVSNLMNISKNSPVQDFEAVVIMRAMREIHGFFKENSMKSYLFGMIHDAVPFYLHVDELEIAVPKIFEIFERDYPEYNGIPMEFDLDVADPSKGEVWGFGREMNHGNYREILFR